jgi:hypothetical protein
MTCRLEQLLETLKIVARMYRRLSSLRWILTIELSANDVLPGPVHRRLDSLRYLIIGILHVAGVTS